MIQSSPRRPLQSISPNKKRIASSPLKQSAISSSSGSSYAYYHASSPIKKKQLTTSSKPRQLDIPSSPLLPHPPTDATAISSTPTIYDDNSSSELANNLRLRLRLAYYKVVTNQKTKPVNKLAPPDSWSIKAFLDATAKSRRSSFRIKSFQPKANNDSQDSAAQSLLSLAM